MVPAVSALLFTLLAACGGARPDAADALALDKPRHCAHCGWIEAKREMVPGIADPHAQTVYEYTVRMADGSRSMFREKLPVSWRLGERLILIGGAGAVD
jgi:hypothetical protein